MTPELTFNQTSGFTFKFWHKNRGVYKWSPWEESLNRVESNPKTCQLTTWPRPGVETKLEQDRFAKTSTKHRSTLLQRVSLTLIDYPRKIGAWYTVYPSLTSPPHRGTRNHGLRLTPTLHRIGKVRGRELVEVELLWRALVRQGVGGLKKRGNETGQRAVK